MLFTNKEQRHGQFDPTPNTFKEYFTIILLRFKRHLHVFLGHLIGRVQKNVQNIFDLEGYLVGPVGEVLCDLEPADRVADPVVCLESGFYGEGSNPVRQQDTNFP